MCITAECPEPTEVGVWWRDDAAWRLYSKSSMRAILEGLLKGTRSLYLDLASPAHPRGFSYHIDLSKMEQTNRSSGHKRSIKLILPRSFQNAESNFFNKVQHSFAATNSPGAAARFRLPSSCLLLICKGNIANWAVDGETDAVVCPRHRWPGFQGRKDTNASSLLSSTRQTLMTELRIFDNEPTVDENKHGSENSNISSRHQSEQGKRNVAASLHHAAGPQLQESLHKCVQFVSASGHCGDAMITSGFKLPSSRVIHAIAPKYRSSQNAVSDSCGLLERTYKGVLALAAANRMRYVAFPAMACGAGGFPVGVAAQVAMKVVKGSTSDDGGVKEIHFVLMGEEGVYEEWVMQASKFFPNN